MINVIVFYQFIITFPPLPLLTFNVFIITSQAFFALLSLDAAKMRNIKVVGIVNNTRFSSDPRLDADAQNAILRHMKRLGYPPALVTMPSIDASSAPDIDFSEIFA